MTKTKSLRLTGWQWALCIFALNILFRMINITYGSYFLDEAANLWHFQQDYSHVIERALNDPNPPGYGLTISAWIKTFGVSEFSTRMFSVLMMSTCAVVLFRMLHRMVDIKLAIVASVLFLLNDFLLLYSHAARPYAMLCLLVVLSYYFLLEYLKKYRHIYLILYFIASVGILYTHPTASFNFLAHGALGFIYIRRYPWMVAKYWLAIVGAVALYYLWQHNAPIYNKDISHWVLLPSWGTFEYNVFSMFGKWIPLILPSLAISVLILWLFKRIKLSLDPVLVVMILWTVLPIAGSIIFSFVNVVSIFSNNYNITIIPGVLTCTAFLLYLIFKDRGKLLWVATGIVAILMIGGLNFTRNFGENWRAAADFVRNNKGENTAVFIAPLYQGKTFTYYYDRSSYEDPENLLYRMRAQDIYFENTMIELNQANYNSYSEFMVIVDSPNPDETAIIKQLNRECHQTTYINYDRVTIVRYSNLLATNN